MSASRLKPATKRHNANISMAYGCEKDNNVYCYRLVDGKTRFHRVILGPGWENQPFDYKKLSCYVKSEKGEESMAHKTGPHENWLDWDKLMPQVRDLLATGKSIPRTADILGIKVDTLRKRLKKEQEQEAETVSPDKSTLCEICGCELYGAGLWVVADNGQTVCEKCYAIVQTEPGGDQPDPAQEAQEPADKSIEPLTFEGNHFNPDQNYTPADNDYNDRRTALSLFCENQAVEQLRQDWAGEVFRHRDLSREKKLELIGRLLDWGVAY